VSSAGKLDLILGAPGADGASATKAGRVYVIPTPAGEVVAGSSGVTVLGATANVAIGLAMVASDLDGDGRTELAIGNRADAGRRGTVHVLSGTRLVPGATLDLGAGQFDGRIVGPPNGLFGWSLAIADVDGNGKRELVVGARDAATVYLFEGAHALMAADTLAGQFDLAFIGPQGSLLGSSLAVGNLDGDTASDLLMGAPALEGPGARSGAGVAYAVRGSQVGVVASGSQRTIQLSTQTAALAVYGAAMAEGLGDHVALARFDLSGARDQMLVSAQAGGINSQGRVYAVQGLP
jgi:hypothetical protein